MKYDAGPGRPTPSIAERGFPKYWAFRDHRTMAQVMADEVAERKRRAS